MKRVIRSLRTTYAVLKNAWQDFVGVCSLLLLGAGILWLLFGAWMLLRGLYEVIT